LKDEVASKPKISFHLFGGFPRTPFRFFRKVRKFLGLLCARYRARPEAQSASPRAPMRTQKHKATTRSARAKHAIIAHVVQSKFELGLVFLHQIKQNSVLIY